MIENKSSKPNDHGQIKTVEEIIKETIKSSPDIDRERADMQRGKMYYLTGGDPDTRNPI